MKIRYWTGFWLLFSLGFPAVVLADPPLLVKMQIDALLNPLGELPEGSGRNESNKSLIDAATRKAHIAFGFLQTEADARFKLRPRRPSPTEALSNLIGRGSEHTARTWRMLQAVEAADAINAGNPPTDELYGAISAQNPLAWQGEDPSYEERETLHVFRDFFSVEVTQGILRYFSDRLDRMRVHLYPPLAGDPPTWSEFRLAKLAEHMRDLIARLPVPAQPNGETPEERNTVGSERMPVAGTHVPSGVEIELRALYHQLMMIYSVILLRSTGAEHELESIRDISPEIVWERIQAILIAHGRAHPVCPDSQCIEGLLNPDTVEELKLAIQQLIKQIEQEMRSATLEANERAILSRAKKIVKAGFPVRLLLERMAPARASIEGPSTTTFRWGPKLGTVQTWLIGVTENARAKLNERARQAAVRRVEALKARSERLAQREAAYRVRAQEQELNEASNYRYGSGRNYTYIEKPPSFLWNYGVPLLAAYTVAAVVHGVGIVAGGLLLETVVPGGLEIERAITPVFDFVYGFGSHGFDNYIVGGYIITFPVAGWFLVRACLEHGQDLEDYEKRRRHRRY